MDVSFTVRSKPISTARVRDLVRATLDEERVRDALISVAFVGERTIETHVSNILSKLGFDARTQIAAWAVDKDLTKNKHPSK